MSGLSSRIGREILKLRKPVIRMRLNHSLSAMPHTSIMHKIAIASLGVGYSLLITLPPLYAMDVYEQNLIYLLCSLRKTNMKFGDYDKPCTYVVKGMAKASDVDVIVTDKGTMVRYKTNLNKETKYENTLEYKASKYKFEPKEGTNPEVIYFQGDNISVISIGLSEIKKKPAIQQKNQ